MNVNLPVKIYDKCVHIPFDIEINNNLIIITPNHELKIHNIILCSDSYGIITIPICFPLIFHIVNNELVSDLFYVFYEFSSENEIDFINQLIKYLKNFKLYKNINISNLINILKLHNNDNNIDDNIIHKNYNRLIKYINFCLFVMSDNITNISNNSKIIHIINLIKKIKINFYGNNTTVEEHINFINNPKLIIKKRFYFYEYNNKIIKKIYEQVQNNYKTYLTPYPKKYSEFINIKNLLNHLIINRFDLLFDSAYKILFKKNIEIGTHIVNIIINNNKDSIYELDKINNNINENYLSNISFDKFKQLDLTIININDIYNNNIYPINFDKRTLNENFAKILFYYFNINIDVHINQKMKSIIIFIIKMYKSFLNNESTSINNNRIYNESMLYNIIKILLFNDTFNLFNIPNILIIRNKFITNTMIIHILNNLSWKTISKQLAVFKYIISFKDECKELILVDGKINKAFTPNMDNRLKKIIIDPIIMFNYLKKEEDFYKWIINFKDQTIKIFNNMINLEEDDYIKLSKILFCYSKIKNQSINDNNYKKLLNLLKMNNKIILFNDRINIKFKDVFKNVNINLGYLARDIVNEETISVTISEDSENDQLYKLKKKYFKYKGKYLEMKYTES